MPRSSSAMMRASARKTFGRGLGHLADPGQRRAVVRDGGHPVDLPAVVCFQARGASAAGRTRACRVAPSAAPSSWPGPKPSSTAAPAAAALSPLPHPAAAISAARTIALCIARRTARPMPGHRRAPSGGCVGHRRHVSAAAPGVGASPRSAGRPGPRVRCRRGRASRPSHPPRAVRARRGARPRRGRGGPRRRATPRPSTARRRSSCSRERRRSPAGGGPAAARGPALAGWPIPTWSRSTRPASRTGWRTW